MLHEIHNSCVTRDYFDFWEFRKN